MEYIEGRQLLTANGKTSDPCIRALASRIESNRNQGAAPQINKTPVSPSPAMINAYAACHNHGVVIARYSAALPGKVVLVVDADHHFAFAAAHEVGHPLVVLERKVHSVAGGLPVRRIHVVEGMGAVVAFSAFKPGKVFDAGAGQALPSGREVFLDPQQVDGRGSRRRAERLTGDLAGEGMVLQVEESGGALDVGEGFGAGHFLPFEHLPRTEPLFLPSAIMLGLAMTITAATFKKHL